MQEYTYFPTVRTLNESISDIVLDLNENYVRFANYQKALEKVDAQIRDARENNQRTPWVRYNQFKILFPRRRDILDKQYPIRAMRVAMKKEFRRLTHLQNQ